MSDSPTKAQAEEENYAENDPQRHVFPIAAITATLSEIKLAKPETKSKLTSKTLKGIADYIRTNPKKIILLTGAGISTNAGIPDFRSPETGLYENLQKYKLPYPEAIFELEFFKNNPKPFYELAQELYPGKFKPTLTHRFIKLLADKNLLYRIYTQNIDTLERIAGIPHDLIVEAHGTFHTAHCISAKCNTEYSQEWVKHQMSIETVPLCTKCQNFVKPDISFFGEDLPARFNKLAAVDFIECDLLIVIGTSLQVRPFADLIKRVGRDVPRLLINREEVGVGSHGGFEFEKASNKAGKSKKKGSSWFKNAVATGASAVITNEIARLREDVFWKGDCDEGCKLFANLLEWDLDGSAAPVEST